MLTHECKGNASYKHLSIKQENIDLYYKNKPRIFATVPKDYITGFAFEGEFVGDYPNCLSGKTSEVAIVAGTSCKVYMLEGGELCKLLDSDDMRNLKQTIFEHLFSQVYTQYLDTYRMTTRERYKRLLLRCPEIVQSINLKDIASYLKVTPTTISNIRREITFGQ